MLHLASNSPRRRLLLAEAGIEFVLCEPGDEVEGRGPPIDRARQRAASKARGAIAPAGAIVLGVDTVVECQGAELGKPRDRADARRMIEHLAGRQHLVHSAHCLVRGETSFEVVATSRVWCAPLHGSEIDRYLDSGDWADKAGGYGIQSAAGEFMQLRGGALDTVIGLSVQAVRELLKRSKVAG